MPAGSPYHGRIVEYPSIRVDAFQTPRDVDEFTVNLYLLTHTHADHIGGLEAPSFSQLVTCSVDAKQMLLLQEKYIDRIAYDRKEIARKVFPWSHLHIPRGILPRDLLRPIPLNTPVTFQLDGTNEVTITAIDANHCPGAVMYLIEGNNGAVLHTGDMRAETSFLDTLRRHPSLSRYLAPDPEIDYRERDATTQQDMFQTLTAIYLDTACLLGTAEVTSKADATAGLISLMALYPPDTQFFLNTWTWGYEDVIKAVARSFGSKIHVDRYKKGIYAALKSDPLLNNVTTTDPHATRFHACERFNRCECVPATDRDVIYVNAVECPKAAWDAWRQETYDKILGGERVSSLIVPLARHSTLPELQRFVGLFRPKRVVPNTVLPQLGGADWACIPAAFGPYMAPGAAELIKHDMRANGYGHWAAHDSPVDAVLLHATELLSESSNGMGPFRSSMENLVAPPGSGPVGFEAAAKLFHRVEHDDAPLRQRNGRKSRTVEHLTAFLPPGALETVGGLIQIIIDGEAHLSTDSSDSSEGSMSQSFNVHKSPMIEPLAKLEPFPELEMSPTHEPRSPTSRTQPSHTEGSNLSHALVATENFAVSTSLRRSSTLASPIRRTRSENSQEQGSPQASSRISAAQSMSGPPEPKHRYEQDITKREEQSSASQHADVKRHARLAVMPSGLVELGAKRKRSPSPPAPLQRSTRKGKQPVPIISLPKDEIPSYSSSRLPSETLRSSAPERSSPLKPQQSLPAGSETKTATSSAHAAGSQRRPHRGRQRDSLRNLIERCDRAKQSSQSFVASSTLMSYSESSSPAASSLLTPMASEMDLTNDESS